MTLEDFLDRLRGATGQTPRKGVNGQWQACCPVHEADGQKHTPSLSVKRGTAGIVVKCFAGCSVEEICAAAALDVKDLFYDSGQSARRVVATFDYCDETGALLFQVVRYEPKDFRQRRPDGKGGWIWNLDGVARPLYRLPELLKVDEGAWIFIVEGEKDVENIRALGLPSTCNSGGAGKWQRLADDSPLHGRRVCIIPDRDDAGRKHALDVANRLYGKADVVKIIALPEIRGHTIKDVSDWLDALDSKEPGELKTALLKMAEAAPIWRPSADITTLKAGVLSAAAGGSVRSQGGPGMNAKEIPSALAVEEAQKKLGAIHAQSLAPTPAPFHPTAEVAEHCTDVGNATRFDLRHNREVKFCAPWDKWLIWDGARWKPDDSLEIVRLAKETALSIFDEAKQRAERDEKSDKLSRWAARSQERSRLDAMIALARPDLAVTPEALDRGAFLLNVENCTIDLRKGEAQPHSREDLITKLAPVAYDTDAKAPRWEKFLIEIFAGNQALIEYLRRFVGYCLTGDVSEQCFHVFYGAGANGKSVLVDTLAALLGDYAVIAPADLLTARHGDDGHPTELTTLCGKRLAVASETEEGRKLRTSRVKALTGDSKLTARYMRADNFTFQQTHKIVLITNHKPRIPDDSAAIWRRVRLVPFNVQFAEAEQDKSLLKKLRGEFSGILNWAVQGCLAWQREGLRPPDEVSAATKEYREAEDVLADFLAERCGFDGCAYVERGELFVAYEAWAAEHGEKYPMNRRNFYENIRRREGVSEKEQKISGSKERLFVGIGLVNT